MSRKRYSRRARAKRRIRIGLITAAVLLLLFLLFFGFGIRSCEITGNYHNSDAEISEMVFQGLSRRSAVLLGLTRGNYVPKDSRAEFIDHIEVRTTGAASVRVRVVEKPVVGYLQYEGRYWYFDREGVVLVCSEYTENELRAMAENTSSEEAPAPETEEGEIEPESRLAGLSSGRTGFAVAMTGADAEDEEEDPEEEEDEEESDEEEESSEDEEDPADEEEDPSEDGGEDTDGESEDEEEDEDSEEEEEEEEDGEETDGHPETVIEFPAEQETGAQEIVSPTPTPEPLLLDDGPNFIPLVTGLPIDFIAVGDPILVPNRLTFRMVETVKHFADTNERKPNRIRFLEDQSMSLIYGGAEILLGSGANLELRLEELSGILPKLEGLRGTLHLENYDGTQDRIIFDKADKADRKDYDGRELTEEEIAWNAYVSEAKDAEPSELPDVPSYYFGPAEEGGRVEEFTYEARTYDAEDREMEKYAYVYLPPGYDSGRVASYPVLYLTHGQGGSAEWILGEPGEARPLKYILDHLIEEEKMAPMIVVAMTYYPDNTEVKTNDYDAALTQNFGKELRNDLIPALERNYRTDAQEDGADLTESRSRRAIAGFSMGGVMTWYRMTDCLDICRYFVPMSGSLYWGSARTLATYAGDSDDWTAEYLIGEIDRQGIDPEDYRIFAFDGSEDFSEPSLSFQIEAMKRFPEYFAFSRNLEYGNLFYQVLDGVDHDYEGEVRYLYNVLQVLSLEMSE